MPEPRDPKPASEHTARLNAAVGATLGLSRQQGGRPVSDHDGVVVQLERR